MNWSIDSSVAAMLGCMMAGFMMLCGASCIVVIGALSLFGGM